MVTNTERRLYTSRTHIVRAEDCATRWGNDGLTVLSTPAILGTMEQVCVDLLTPTLAANEMTVGTDVEMAHTAPAGLGDEVTYEVTLHRTGRRIEVEFTVRDSVGVVVSSGRHRRAVIRADRFLSRVTAPRAV